MGVFCDRLNFVSTAPPTAVLAKTKADIEKKSSYCHSSCWLNPIELNPTIDTTRSAALI